MGPKLARGGDVPIEITDPRVRAARLRRLPAERFVPPHPATTDAAFAADVRAFAVAFWSLAPAERRARWRELAQTPAGAAAARLGDLEPGLGVAPVAQPDPRAAELADLVRELFVLPPAARAARRVAWLTAPDRRDAAWAAASRTVLRTDLPLARLEERLFDWLARGDRPAAVAAVAESAAWVRQPGRPVHEPAPLPPPAAAAGGFGCLSSSGSVLFVLFVLAKLFGAVDGCKRYSTPTPPPRPPAYTSPAFPPPAGVSFTHGEVLQFFTYEQAKHKERLEPGEGPPPRYDLWVERGRPGWSQYP